MSRRVRQLSLKECYEILHLEKGASLEDLKKSYRKRAFELHPDLNPGNPAAGRDFQLLNEAYVALSAVLKPRGDKEQKQEQKKQEQKKQEQPGQEQQKASGKSASDAAGEYAKQQARSGQSAGRSASSGATSAQAGPTTEQDVLKDILDDPFARRVFEDIYSELNRKQSSEQPQPDRKARPQSASAPQRDVVRAPREPEKGVKGAVKGWLRRQIDEEQSLTLPRAFLAPGRKVRLQIRQGLSEDLRTVEITLPPDFTIGKPVRLKGLGKRVGPWQGDLYLTIYNE